MVEDQSQENVPSLRSSDPGLATLIEGRLDLPIHDADHLVELMSRVADLAVEYIDGADHAGITVVFEGSRPLTVAPTDQRVEDFDSGQYRLNQGPCLLASSTDRTVVIDLEEMAVRWPELAEVSRRCGISRVVASPVHRHRMSVGSLNLYTDGTTTVMLSATSPVLVMLLEHLDRGMDDYSDSLAAFQRVHALHSALEDRAVIDTAVGMIIESRRCTRDEALEYLDHMTRVENTSLRSAADKVVADRGV